MLVFILFYLFILFIMHQAVIPAEMKFDIAIKLRNPRKVLNGQYK